MRWNYICGPRGRLMWSMSILRLGFYIMHKMFTPFSRIPPTMPMRLSLTAGLALFFGVAVGRPPIGQAAVEGSGWYRVALDAGETSGGYHWGASATGRKTHLMKRICIDVSIVEPTRAGLPVEAEETKSCGRLTQPSDYVSTNVIFGDPEESEGELHGLLFRPIVQKVVFSLNNGHRTAYPQSPNSISPTTGNIYRFRYLFLLLKRTECIKGITTYNRSGDVVAIYPEPQCDS